MKQRLIYYTKFADFVCFLLILFWGYDRTDAVKSILVEKGVEDDNIECLGLGIYSHMYDDDEFVDGVYDGDSEAAKRNRSVFIMEDGSNTAERFREDYKKIG